MFASSFCSLFVLGASYDDIQVWGPDGIGLTSFKIPVNTAKVYNTDAEFDVNIKPSGDMPHEKYWLKAQKDTDALRVDTNNPVDQHQRWTIRSRNGIFEIRNNVGTVDGHQYVWTSDDLGSDNVGMSANPTDRNSWYFERVGPGVYHIIAKGQIGNLPHLEKEEQQADDEQAVTLRGSSRRRRGAYLHTSQSGDVDLNSDDDARTKWRIQVPTCTVVSPDQITGSWEFQYTVPDNCNPNCHHQFDKGFIEEKSYQLDGDFKASVHAKAKAGMHLAGFGAKAKISASMSLQIAGQFQDEMLHWSRDKWDMTFQASDMGRQFWQFKIESTDICGATSTTYTENYKMTDGDISDHQPCCVPGHFQGTSSTACSSEDFFMPGAKKSGHCTAGPAPPPGPGPDTWYKTITPSSNTNLCLDLPGDSASDGAPLWLWECNGGESQRWVFDNYQLRFGADESKCIDAGDMSNGMQLRLWDCSGVPQQTWGFDSDAARVYLTDTSTCLDFYEDWQSNGQPLHVWECSGNSNQEWSLWPVGSKTFNSEIEV